MRISEIEWNGGRGLEDLSIHAIGSTKALAEHLAEMLEQPELIDGPDVRSALVETIIGRLDEAERALNRFGDELVKPTEGDA